MQPALPIHRALSFAHAKGEGVVKDDSEAVRWYRLAADQGYANAQFKIGFMYANGRGVPKDLTTAHMWWNISSANGHEKAGLIRDEVEILMTGEQFAESERRANVRMSSNYQDCD